MENKKGPCVTFGEVEINGILSYFFGNFLQVPFALDVSFPTYFFAFKNMHLFRSYGKKTVYTWPQDRKYAAASLTESGAYYHSPIVTSHEGQINKQGYL